MSETVYTAVVRLANGDHVDTLETIVNCQWSRSLNAVGALALTIPYQDYLSYLSRNARIYLYRRGRDGRPRLAGDTVWLLRRAAYSGNNQTITLHAEDFIGLLNRRIVAYTANTPYADKTLEEFGLITPNDSLRLDSIIIAYVQENLGSLALNTARDLSEWISIPDSMNLGPYGEKQAEFAKLLPTLQDCARQADAQGTPIFFDFIPTITGQFAFRVWVGQRGLDRTSDGSDQIIFSEESGELIDVEVVYDYSEEGNVCYAIGGDSGAARIYEEVLPNPNPIVSPFDRSEFTIQVNGEGGHNRPYLQLQGQGALRGQRARVTLGGRLRDVGDIIFGRDYNFGDRVIGRARDLAFPCLINTVNASLQDGNEDIDIRLSGTVTL